MSTDPTPPPATTADEPSAEERALVSDATLEAVKWMRTVVACSQWVGTDGMCACARAHFAKLAAHAKAAVAARDREWLVDQQIRIEVHVHAAVIKAVAAERGRAASVAEEGCFGLNITAAEAEGPVRLARNAIAAAIREPAKGGKRDG